MDERDGSEVTMEIVGNKVVLKISPMEATYIARLLGYDELFGFGDPFSGWLVEEIREVWEDIRGALVDRGIIYEDSGGNVRVDLLTSEAIGLFCRPEQIFLVYTGSRDRVSALRVCCRRGTLYAIHDMEEPGDEQATITLGENMSDFYENFLDAVAADADGQVVGESATEDIWEIWARILRGGERVSVEGSQNAGEQGFNPHKEMKNALENMRRFLGVISLKLLDGRWEPSTFLCISNGDSGWTALMIPGGETSFKGKTVREAVREFIAEALIK